MSTRKPVDKEFRAFPIRTWVYPDDAATLTPVIAENGTLLGYRVAGVSEYGVPLNGLVDEDDEQFATALFADWRQEVTQ